MEDCKLESCQLKNSLEQKYDVVVAYTPTSDTFLQFCKVVFFFILYQLFFTSNLEL